MENYNGFLNPFWEEPNLDQRLSKEYNINKIEGDMK